MESIKLKTNPKQNIIHPIPPHNGYGTEEDSMLNVKYLNFQHKGREYYVDKFKRDKHILRFLSKLVSPIPSDEERSFFTITIPVNKDFLSKDQKLISDKNDDNTTAKKRRSPAEIKQLIFDLLSKEGSLSKAELVKKMGYTKLTDAVSKAIGELLAEQKIKYTEIKLNSKNQKLMLFQ